MIAPWNFNNNDYDNNNYDKTQRLSQLLAVLNLYQMPNDSYSLFLLMRSNS